MDSYRHLFQLFPEPSGKRGFDHSIAFMTAPNSSSRWLVLSDTMERCEISRERLDQGLTLGRISKFSGIGGEKRVDLKVGAGSSRGLPDNVKHELHILLDVGGGRG